MARSRRRTPIVSMTTTASEKADKRHANRNCRAALRRVLRADNDPDAAVLPILRDVSDPWTMAKDGKGWIGYDTPKLLRK